MSINIYPAKTVKLDPTSDITVSEKDSFTVFQDILKELKKINLHLSFIDDHGVANKDVES